MADDALLHRHAQLRRQRRRGLDSFMTRLALNLRVHMRLMRKHDRVRSHRLRLRNVRPLHFPIDHITADAPFRRLLFVQPFMALVATFDRRHPSVIFLRRRLVATRTLHLLFDVSLVIERQSLPGKCVRDALLIAPRHRQQRQHQGDDPHSSYIDPLAHKTPLLVARAFSPCVKLTLSRLKIKLKLQRRRMVIDPTSLLEIIPRIQRRPFRRLPTLP